MQPQLVERIDLLLQENELLVAQQEVCFPRPLHACRRPSSTHTARRAASQAECTGGVEPGQHSVGQAHPAQRARSLQPAHTSPQCTRGTSRECLHAGAPQRGVEHCVNAPRQATFSLPASTVCTAACIAQCGVAHQCSMHCTAPHSSIPASMAGFFQHGAPHHHCSAAAQRGTQQQQQQQRSTGSINAAPWYGLTPNKARSRPPLASSTPQRFLHMCVLSAYGVAG
jgi:hypothetical protein